jgi:hypothetical protein
MQSKLAQQTSAAAHICTTATGRLFITNQSNKCRFLIVTGSDLCVFPRKLIPHMLITTTERLTALPSPHTDDCLLASTWGYAGNTCIAICSGSCHTAPHRRTPTSNFQHLWHQTSLYGSRNKFQAPPSPHTVTCVPDNLDRTFQPLYASKCSSQHHCLQLPEIRVAVIMSTSLSASTPKQPSLQGSDVRTSHMSDIRQMSVAMQRLVDTISMVTNSTLLCNNTGASSISAQKITETLAIS